MNRLPKEGEAGHDFVDHLGPNEGLGSMIRGFDMAEGDLIQLPHGARHTTLNQLFGRGGGPALQTLAPSLAQLQRPNQSPLALYASPMHLKKRRKPNPIQ